MLRLYIALFVVLILVCGPVAAETVYITSIGLQEVWSEPLAAGQLYQFTVSGRFQYSGSPVSYADAEWILDGVFEFYGPFQEGYTFGQSNDLLDLVINNTSVDWLGTTDGNMWTPHRYSPDHIYRYYYTGTGQSVAFHIADGLPFYPADMTSDNHGFLRVDIVAVPEPSSLVALSAGLGTIGWFARRRRK